MTTLVELIAGIEVEIEQAQARKARSLKEREAILARVQQEGRASLSEEEDARFEELRTRQEEEDEREQGARRRLAQAQEIAAEEKENERAARDTKPTGAKKPAYNEVARVGQEERTYHAGNDPRGGNFVRDVARQFLYGDVQSSTRLARHMDEERIERQSYGFESRAAGTGAFAGLTVPQYLTDLYAPAIAALRPFANICNGHPLPADGMSVNISRITTATGVALQSSENSAVQETNIDDTLLTENIQTAAGQQTLSRQAIDRGTGVEAVVMDDLFRRYATALDATLITQATTGLSAVATSTAFTTASPNLFDTTTPANALYGKIMSATAGVEAALLAYGYPSHAVMHSRRWYWIQSKANSVWPGVTQPNIPVQAAAVNTGAEYNAGVRGYLPNGLAVVVDNNVATNNGTATNEDEIYIVPQSECHLWEDANQPAFIRAEQPAAANLGVLLVVYGYFAYSFRRYTNGMGKVNGTGLTVPTF